MDDQAPPEKIEFTGHTDPLIIAGKKAMIAVLQDPAQSEEFLEILSMTSGPVAFFSYSRKTKSVEQSMTFLKVTGVFLLFSIPLISLQGRISTQKRSQPATQFMKSL